MSIAIVALLEIAVTVQGLNSVLNLMRRDLKATWRYCRLVPFVVATILAVCPLTSAADVAVRYGTSELLAWTVTAFPETRAGTPEAGYPVAIRASECLGRNQAQSDWQERMLSLGYVVVEIDSFGARGFSSEALRAEKVCTGESVGIDERVADWQTVLNELANDPRVNTRRLVVLGWSHGGWAALEWFSQIASDPRKSVGFQISGALLFYPYCVATRSGGWSLPRDIALLVLHGSADRITSAVACRSQLSSLAGRGRYVRVVTLSGARHWFDDSRRPEFFDHAATSRAVAVALEWLDSFSR